ncbi:MAG: aldose epimerase family protein [bacterium]|nr:aldose epimerase family protein [bacterium]
MAVEKGTFGKLSQNKDIEFFVLKNKTGIEARLISFGAALVSLKVPDKNGKFADIVLGYDDLAGYMNDKCYFGCTVGRFANRIANAKFTLDGREYKLIANDGKNHLHGGIKGFNRAPWQAESFEDSDGCGVIFKYLSPDGEEGYPGNLDVTVTYTLTDDNELKVGYQAVTDKKTIVNLTSHSYFNLAGHNKGSILSHLIQINADKTTVVDSGCIPTGQIKSVKGTEFDLTESKPIGENIGKLGLGYDFNYILNKSSPEELSFAAKVIEPQSGRIMEIFTTEPAVQFYTGNFLNDVAGKAGALYKKHEAFCLETQHYPDSPNRPSFPSTVLMPGETFRQLTAYKFSVQ